jgi:hypothetical protein
MEKEGEKKLTEALFVSLVSSLYSSAMHFMGKIMNPVTGKIDKNLDAAHTNIEILRMLREKTQGNLTEEESRVLGDALSNMQVNYVDELEKEKKEGSSKEKKSEEENTDSGKEAGAEKVDEK